MNKFQTLRKEIEIVNVICTMDLNQKIKIKSFNRFRFLSCDIDIYKCGYVKDDKMIGKVSVFESGKIISIGTKSYDQACDEVKKVIKLLKKYKLIVSTPKDKPVIRNMVGKIDVKQTIYIEKLSQTLTGSRYEPEQFPALIYKMVGKITALIFSTGKIILTGAKSTEDMNRAYFELNQKKVF